MKRKGEIDDEEEEENEPSTKISKQNTAVA